MSNITKAEELFIKYNPQDGNLPKWAKDLMIEFAKLHVEAAIKTIYENYELIKDDNENIVLDKKSIFNAYPLTNIK